MKPKGVLVDLVAQAQYNNPNSFTVLDFETTGFTNNFAVSLALIRVEEQKIVFAKYYLINPNAEIEYGAYKIHGIRIKDVVNQPTFDKIWDEIRPYISGQIVVGHNVMYDIKVIKAEVQRYGLLYLPFKSICTCKNAKKFIEKTNIENYKLDTVCDYFDIKLGSHHDARDDTNACRLIFNQLSNLGELDIKKESLA